MEQRSPFAKGDRVNHNLKFVNQATLGKTDGQVVAPNSQVLARLLFPAVDFLRIDFADESDVFPILLFLDPREGLREDDFVHIID